MFLLSEVFEHARTTPQADGSAGWGLADLKNPVCESELPPAPQDRRHRLHDGEVGQDGEEERMRCALAAAVHGVQMLAPFDLALETGMRLGELLDIRRGQVRRLRVATIIPRGDSKNGDAREVALSTRALAALAGLLREGAGPGERLYSLQGSNVQTNGRPPVAVSASTSSASMTCATRP